MQKEKGVRGEGKREEIGKKKPAGFSRRKKKEEKGGEKVAAGDIRKRDQRGLEKG